MFHIVGDGVAVRGERLHQSFLEGPGADTDPMRDGFSLKPDGDPQFRTVR